MMVASSMLLWGKTDKDSGLLHPLLFHLLDAGYVAKALWEFALPASMKADLAETLRLDIDSAGRLLSFWITLHDLGKAGPAFQGKYAPALPVLSSAGFHFPSPATYTERPHGLVSGWALCSDGLLPEMDEEAREALARAVSGHHGAWPDSDAFEDLSRKANLGDHHWQAARKDLEQVLRQVFDPPTRFQFPSEGQPRNIFLTLFSGMLSVADWLASMQTYFPAVGLQAAWQEYLPQSAAAARQVIEREGWLLWNDPAAGLPFTFAQAFPLNPTPKPIQSAVIELASEAALPALALIEAPTGIGKTEMAFMLADHWQRRSQGRGIYIAMPTQATSNQMYERTCNFLTRRYPAQAVNLHLAHGHALLQPNYEKTVLASVGDDLPSGVAAASWFLPRKRTLLAPFAVGTVDQIFLSVLQTRHFFVRLFGLYGKVVIFDEVHAYDAYQSEIFERLLVWLRALKVSVILLSATLPAQVRAQMVAAYHGKSAILPLDQHYPCLTVADPQRVAFHALPETPSDALALDWLGSSPGDVVSYLREKLVEGGCAAVICNTVARAQEIYEAVSTAQIAPDDTILFHARFPFAWRRDIETHVVETFGRNHPRPGGQWSWLLR